MIAIALACVTAPGAPASDCAGGPAAETGDNATHVESAADLAAAIAGAPDGGELVLASGRWDAAVRIERPVRIVARCPGEVVLAGQAGDPVIEVVGAAGVELAGLAVDSAGGGILAWQEAELLVQDLAITAGDVPLRVSGASVEASELRVAGGQRYAIQLDAGARLDCTDCEVGGGGSVLVDESALSASFLSVTDSVHAAVQIWDGDVALDASTISDSGGSGVLMDGDGAFLAVSNLTIERSGVGDATDHAVGLSVSGGAMSAQDLEVVAAFGIGVFASGGATVDLRGGRVAGTLLPRPPALGGVGVWAGGGSSIRMDGLEASGNQAAGLVSIEGSSIECTGCDLHGNTQVNAFASGATLTISESRMCVDGGVDAVGVLASGGGAETALTIRASELCAHRLASVFLSGPGRFDVSENSLETLVTDESPTIGPWGNAIFLAGTGAWDGSGDWECSIASNVIAGGTDAAVLIAGGAASLCDNMLVGRGEFSQDISRDCAASSACAPEEEPRCDEGTRAYRPPPFASEEIPEPANGREERDPSEIESPIIEG